MKVIQVTLSNGKELQVREVVRSDHSAYLRALPGLSQIAKSLSALQEIDSGVLMPVPDVPEASLQAMDELLVRVTTDITGIVDGDAPNSITIENVQGMQIADWYGVVGALTELMGTNFTRKKTPSAS